MFGKPSINPEMIVATSKVALKTSCLRACDNDIDKAMKLYDFFIKDMPNLPDFDVTPPSAMQQAKEMAVNAFSWLDQNQERLLGYWQMFQQMRGGIVPIATPPTNVPPIPNK